MGVSNETGVFFSNKKFSTDEGEYSPRCFFTFRYIDVPIKTNFYLGKGKIRGLATVGMAVNFRQYRRLKTVYQHNEPLPDEFYIDCFNKVKIFFTN